MKFGREFDHVTTDILQILKIKGQSQGHEASTVKMLKMRNGYILTDFFLCMDVSVKAEK